MNLFPTNIQAILTRVKAKQDSRFILALIESQRVEIKQNSFYHSFLPSFQAFLKNHFRGYYKKENNLIWKGELINCNGLCHLPRFKKF